MDIQALVTAQRAYFSTGATLPLSTRKAALQRLREAIQRREGDICAALRSDLNKSPAESYMCEVGLTLSELSFVEKRLARWMGDRPHLTPLAQFPARSFTVQEPYGVVLIMSPWNYPFLLTLEPLIGAIAAGNCAVVKPSAYSPATSAVIRDILKCFPPEYVAVVEGGRGENQALLDQKFDCIFFTGGVEVGREVMVKAARHLTPVTLELGGKSPCIVDKTARLDLAAKRLVFGKLLNCGQTCVAPDYLLIDRRVKDRFLEYVKRWITVMYGQNPLDNGGYVRMVNRKHFDRVMGLIDPSKVVFGGRGDPDTLKIQPTVLDNVSPEDPVMGEEIFGPLLPILTFQELEEAVRIANGLPHPLALYLFSQDREAVRTVTSRCAFGGGCVNDTVIHLATSHMGFGGVGPSGMGAYHGRAGFETFSHRKSIVDKRTWLDLPMRYQPYSEGKENLIRRFLR